MRSSNRCAGERKRAERREETHDFVSSCPRPNNLGFKESQMQGSSHELSTLGVMRNNLLWPCRARKSLGNECGPSIQKNFEQKKYHEAIIEFKLCSSRNA